MPTSAARCAGAGVAGAGGGAFGAAELDGAGLGAVAGAAADDAGAALGSAAASLSSAPTKFRLELLSGSSASNRWPPASAKRCKAAISSGEKPLLGPSTTTASASAGTSLPKP
jgi:hypothetical protein